MNEQAFSRRQVERSFRKFNDLVTDLQLSQFQTWGDAFTRLITHCEQDPVMRVVTEPLRTNTNVDAKKWLNDALSSQRGMVGSGRYSLPYDDDDRTALLYQFFLLVEYGETFNLNTFCIALYGASRYQDMVNIFNQELVFKFTREVSYRLDEIMQDVGDQQQIPLEAMFVFHHHDNSTNIRGNITGSNVASGGSTISDSSASVTSAVSKVDALEVLKLARESMQELSEADRVKAEVYVDAIEGEVTSDNAQSPQALAFAASLLPLLEKAGAALDVIEKFRNFFKPGESSS